MVTLSDEQRQDIALHGTPVPVIEPDDGKAYLILQVKFARTEDNGFRAIAPGVNAVGDGDLPSDALFSLCMAVQALANGTVRDEVQQ